MFPLTGARGLWQLHGQTLNAERIRDVLRQLEEALAQGDLVASFEAIATPATRRSQT
jgi:hypothetical protein